MTNKVVFPNRLEIYNTYLAVEILSKLVEKKIITESEALGMTKAAQLKTIKYKPGEKLK